MKNVASCVALIALLGASPFAFAGETVHSGVGTVRSVDPGKGVVTLTHGQITDHNMAGMTMDFTITDKRLFDRLQPGKQIAFEFVKERTRNVISAVTPLAAQGAVPGK